MGTTPKGSILPLPEEVVAQIKSSTAIVSLTGVVLELLKNALDAGAGKIEATVDFGRGGCSVEDNGLGIAPLEFSEAGRLGKLYCTSKFHSQDLCLGRNGTFLASLAATSLLTVTSRHHEHRSHNSMTYHHSRVIERQLPALPHQRISYHKHGTRVTVRNLFGNLPVRVKQRAVAVEQRNESDRLWDTLRREVTGLLLSWRRPVHLRIRDATSRPIISINCQAPDASARPSPAGAPQLWSGDLRLMLNILTQANLVTIDDWSSWVAASASTSQVSIKGAISLDPAPTKRVQFISFGIRPLSAGVGHNELYDEVNRIFSLSSFGTIEDDVEFDEAEKARRLHDKRFKGDGYTNRQLRGRKGVDRYPMFHLRISLKDEEQTNETDDEYFDRESNLQAVVDVLNAMITQWLAAHHFQPRKKRPRRELPNAATTFSSEFEGLSPGSSPVERPGVETRIIISEATSAPSSPAASHFGRKKVKMKYKAGSASNDVSKTVHQQPFTDWSRIKSGRLDFYDDLWTSGKRRRDNTAAEPYFPATNLDCACEDSSSPALLDVEPILPGVLDNLASPGRDAPQDLLEGNKEKSDQDEHDNTVEWTDPFTKNKFLLNARTGCVMPHKPDWPCPKHSIQIAPSTLQKHNKSLRLPNSRGKSEANTPWLTSLLDSWDNPIFKPAEKGVQQISLDEQQNDNAYSNHVGCPRVHVEQAFDESLVASSNKLSKSGLADATVVSQLDKKFILVKMDAQVGVSQEPKKSHKTLVLIDQHAADERIRVEALLAELCTPLPNKDAESQYRSGLGHQSYVNFTILERPLQFSISSREGDLFVTHAAIFAVWGILYDVMPAKPPESMSRQTRRVQPLLSVITLPPSVSERCKGDPKVLISFLRSTLWKHADASTLPLLPSHLGSPISSETDEKCPLWLRRLSSCPQGLIDLINSRACRSAIMFNDELSITECKELVQKLSKCVFPFMCAHGRPSMIPLVDLGKVGEGSVDDPRLSLDSEGERLSNKSFIDAWKQWKR
ncbi:hypothetical protein CC78DRAFT_520458 [Lojkania enalia]|uniref:MutL C-terminal dimerisation domain-containing protein n=1 Tax=Lojkania enalia TaxID=147567 RepID=A0A9P4K664_9PLEO|nr:hypothetical protein CC78DRAFT_520458 [Didymosphaeria enalia]